VATNHPVRVVGEEGIECFLQRNGDCCGCVIVRPALKTGKDGAVDRLCVIG
jgi:hypothetical protein